MGSQVVRALTEEKIENFKLSFQKTAFGVFYDDEKNELIHAGEKGTYSEAIAIDFLRPFIPQRLDIGTGFIINSFDDISTQCDIIIYDAQNTPLLENNQRQRFFPVETIVAVGEIKSGMAPVDRTELKTIVNKLAKIRQMKKLQGTPRSVNNSSHTFSERHPSDSITTFLICNDITKKEEIAKEMSELYDSKYNYNDYLSFALFLSSGLLSHKHEGQKNGHTLWRAIIGRWIIEQYKIITILRFAIIYGRPQVQAMFIYPVCTRIFMELN